jgi:hypothetical protein
LLICYLSKKHKEKQDQKEELIVPKLSAPHNVGDQHESRVMLKPTIYDRERSEESVVQTKNTLTPKQSVKDLTIAPLRNQSL